MSVERSKCPTCGGDVVIYTGREGTSHMVPANSADQTEAFIERDQLRGAVEARDAMRQAIHEFLVGAPLDDNGRFEDARLEALYRAAGGR